MNGRQEWQSLMDSAILRKHSGDIVGAIKDIERALDLAKAIPNTCKDSAEMLNYLADLYLTIDQYQQAEKTIREAIRLSKELSPFLHGDNLLMLAEIQRLNRQYGESLVSAKLARDHYALAHHSHGVLQANEVIKVITSLLDGTD